MRWWFFLSSSEAKVSSLMVLHLVNQPLHALVVLLILVRSEGELFDGPLRLPEVLLSIAQPAGLGIHL